MRRVRISTIALLLLVATVAVRADYLELKHTASLKTEPRSDSETVVKLSPPVSVVLLQEQQENGYYLVKVLDTGEQGWVYRTMGRRHRGMPEPVVNPARQQEETPVTEADFAIPSSHEWGTPAKTSGCVTRNGLPDPACTPGDVRPDATAEQICSSLFRTGSVRNKTTTQSQKNKVYPGYGIPHPENNTGSSQVCEIDHLVPLQLGGADTMANLWPQCSPGYQRWSGPGFREKDGYENYLWFHVCVNQDMTLKEAQIAIATNWRRYWELAGKPDCHNRQDCE